MLTYRIRFWFVLLSVLISCQSSLYAENKDLKSIDGPRIYIPQKLKDFGDVNQGAVIEQEFEIQNQGSKDLIIRSLNPACGCTAAVINDPVIKPGNKSQIRLSFNTLGFRGNKEKVLRVYSNDPLNSSEVISIKANILQDIKVEPDLLELGEVLRREGFKRKLSVSSPTNAVFKISELIPKSSFISANIVGAENKTAAYEVNVFSEGKLPLGNTRTRLVIKTDSKETPTIIVPISFYVVGDLLASPKAVNFGFISKSSSNDGALSRVVRISKSSESLNTRVEYLEKSNREIDADLSEDATGQYVTLHLNSLANGIIRGTLRLYTDSEIEDERLLEVPYFAVVGADANE